MSAKPAVPGDGSIFPYKGSRWAAFVWVITPTGEKARKWLYGDTKEELEPAFNELKVQAAKVPLPTSTPTVTEYLKYWLAEVIKPNREDGTHSAYELSSRLYIIPGIGAKSIDPRKLTVRVTQAWLNKLAVTCQCCAQKKDAKRTEPRCCAADACCEDYPSRRVIEGARNTLRAALNNAMREELIGRNVAELVTLPKSRKKSTRRSSWDAAEALQFLESSKRDNDPLYPLWALILVLGIRRGEGLGLTVDSVDEEKAEVGLEWQLGRVGGHPITHKQQLKTDGSVDTLPLPPIVLTALRMAREYQEKRRTDKWPVVCICGTSHQLLFTTATGQPLEPRNVKRSFDARCKRAGVRQIKIHDTRRTCGSLLAALEVHPRVAMAVLRHTKISMTMEIYSQVPDKTVREALQRLSDLLSGHQADADASHAAEDDTTDTPPEDHPETTESD